MTSGGAVTAGEVGGFMTSVAFDFAAWWLVASLTKSSCPHNLILFGCATSMDSAAVGELPADLLDTVAGSLVASTICWLGASLLLLLLLLLLLHRPSVGWLVTTKAAQGSMAIGRPSNDYQEKRSRL